MKEEEEKRNKKLIKIPRRSLGLVPNRRPRNQRRVVRVYPVRPVSQALEVRNLEENTRPDPPSRSCIRRSFRSNAAVSRPLDTPYLQSEKKRDVFGTFPRPLDSFSRPPPRELYELSKRKKELRSFSAKCIFQRDVPRISRTFERKSFNVPFEFGNKGMFQGRSTRRRIIDRSSSISPFSLRTFFRKKVIQVPMTRHVVGADGVVEYVELISTRPCDCPTRVSSIR